MSQLNQTTSLADIEGKSLITVEELAAVLGLGRAAAYHAANCGQFPTRRLGRRIFIPVPALLAWLGSPSAA